MNLEYALEIIKNLIDRTRDPADMPRLTPLEFDAVMLIYKTCEQEF